MVDQPYGIILACSAKRGDPRLLDCSVSSGTVVTIHEFFSLYNLFLDVHFFGEGWYLLMAVSRSDVDPLSPVLKRGLYVSYLP